MRVGVSRAIEFAHQVGSTGSVRGLTGRLQLVLLLVLSMAASACVSSSEGRRMRGDIETLNARFEELATSLQADRHRLTELIETAETEIVQLQSALAEAQEILRRSSADLGMQVDQYGEELQTLRGQIEHADFRLNQIQEQLNLFMEDIDMRLQSR